MKRKGGILCIQPSHKKKEEKEEAFACGDLDAQTTHEEMKIR